MLVSYMDEKQLDIVVGNIMYICKVRVKSPPMFDDLRKYVVDLEKDILAGKYSEGGVNE